MAIDGPLPIGDIIAGGILIYELYEQFKNIDVGKVKKNIENIRMFGKGKKQSKKSQKERSTKYPSWQDNKPPKKGEDRETYLRRILDERYGKGKWDKGPTSDYNQIKKSIDRGGNKAWNSVNK